MLRSDQVDQARLLVDGWWQCICLTTLWVVLSRSCGGVGMLTASAALNHWFWGRWQVKMRWLSPPTLKWKSGSKLIDNSSAHQRPILASSVVEWRQHASVMMAVDHLAMTHSPWQSRMAEGRRPSPLVRKSVWGRVPPTWWVTWCSYCCSHIKASEKCSIISYNL